MILGDAAKVEKANFTCKYITNKYILLGINRCLLLLDIRISNTSKINVYLITNTLTHSFQIIPY